MNKYTKLLCAILVIVTLFAVTTTCYAHSGNTDSKGGHRDSSGSYHYHHGYPAHQHTGGVCPYDYDDKTSSGSGYSSNSSYTPSYTTSSSSSKSSSNSSNTSSYKSSSSASKSNDISWSNVVVLIFVIALIGIGISKLLKSTASAEKEQKFEDAAGCFTTIAVVMFLIIAIGSFFV